MGAELDPEWEYYRGDAEVEELLAEAAAQLRQGGGFDAAFASAPEHADRRRDGTGFRVGRGNPDSFEGRLGREKTAGKGREQKNEVRCPGCGVAFVPRRKGQRHCSRACSPRPGRPRERPRDCACRHCGAAFEPKEIGHDRYCSPACANRASGAARKREAAEA